MIYIPDELWRLLASHIGFWTVQNWTSLIALSAVNRQLAHVIQAIADTHEIHESCGDKRLTVRLLACHPRPYAVIELRKSAVLLVAHTLQMQASRVSMRLFTKFHVLKGNRHYTVLSHAQPSGSVYFRSRCGEKQGKLCIESLTTVHEIKCSTATIAALKQFIGSQQIRRIYS